MTKNQEIKTLESIYQQKINSLEELKKSILKKAFTEELTEKLGFNKKNPY